MRRHWPEKGEALIERLKIDLRRHEFCREDRLDLRRKGQVLARGRIVQRLDSGPVPDQQELFFRFVPDGECKHAVQAFQTIRPPFGVRLEQDLWIRTCTELV